MAKAHRQRRRGSRTRSTLTRMQPLTALGLTALGGLGYCLAEARAYTLREISVPGPTAAAGMRVLHISDLHLAPWDTDRIRWVSSLEKHQADLIIASGDFMAHERAVPLVARALESLLTTPGVFVLGSNDFYAPKFKNPFAYLGRNNSRVLGTPLPTQDLQALLSSGGWLNLDNARGHLRVRNVEIEFRGTADAHINLDDYSRVAGPWSEHSQLRIAVTHAPYARVLSAMTSDSPDMVLAGHTHGGQITIPFVSALTTNCDLPVKQARGLSWLSAPEKSVPLHVSAGVGTSPIFPVRLGCRPEATLITFA